MTNGCPEAAIEIMPIHDHQISNRIHSNQMADGIPCITQWNPTEDVLWSNNN